MKQTSGLRISQSEGHPEMARRDYETKPNLIPLAAAFRSKSEIVFLWTSKPHAEINCRGCHRKTVTSSDLI